MLIDIHSHNDTVSNDALRILSLYQNFLQAATARYCSIGLHPCYIDDHEKQLEVVEQYATLPNVLAIGECGLDNMCNKDAALQADIFRKQVELAGRLDKPLIIHCVRAFDELLRTVKELQPAAPMIVHGYNKKPDIANKLLATGMYLSFGAAILNDSWPAAQVLRDVPANRLFLETDDADVPIHEIYARAAHLRKTDVETLILQVEQNFKEVFKREL